MFGESGGSIILAGGTVGRYLISSTNSTTGVTMTNPVRITHITLSSATTGSLLQIFNGQGGALELLVNGTNGKVVDVDYGVIGHTFSNGAYILPDGNANLTVISCKSDLV